MAADTVRDAPSGVSGNASRREAMAKFVMNKQYNDKKEIEADFFKEDGSYTVFISVNEEQVFACKTDNVHTIENLSLDQ
ncbi:hypothetical protein O4216_14975 [Rhodococcus erythropolis]|nr:hypothetical protein [Rhodococcus erythropolis]